MVNINRLIFGRPEDNNKFAFGYETAHQEIRDVIAQGEEHERECVDCPACEVIRMVRREIVKRLTGEHGHLELLLLLGLADEFYDERD